MRLVSGFAHEAQVGAYGLWAGAAHVKAGQIRPTASLQHLTTWVFSLLASKKKRVFCLFPVSVWSCTSKADVPL